LLGNGRESSVVRWEVLTWYYVNLILVILVELSVGTKRSHNKTARVKRALVQGLNHIYMTNKQMHICKYVFVENCPLEGYYVASSVKITRWLVTQKSAVLIYLLPKLQIVHLLVCCVSVPLFLVLGYLKMKILNHAPVKAKFWPWKKPPKFFSSMNDTNFTTVEKISVMWECRWVLSQAGCRHHCKDMSALSIVKQKA
jgi:hypothetical protein